MKIPIYESQASLTRESPGQSISARYSMAGPRAIAEQGKVLQTAIAEVGSYAEMQYKMLDETQRNDAIFGAKEGIRDLLSEYKRGNDTTVLKIGKDGKSKWDRGMDGIRERLLQELPNWFEGGSRASKQLFEDEFKIASSNAKFQLSENIADRIEANFAASTKQRAESLVDVYSNINALPDNFDMDLATVEQALERAANNGLINPGLVQQIPTEIREKVAENLADAYTGSSAQRALNLNRLITTYQTFLAKPEDATAKANFEFALRYNENNNGQYTAQMLLSINPGEAIRIVSKSLNRAASLQRVQEAAQKDADKLSATATTRMMSVIQSSELDPDKNTITLNRLTNLGVSLNVQISDAMKGTIRDRLINEYQVDGTSFPRVDADDNGRLNIPVQKVQRVLSDFLRTDTYFNSKPKNITNLDTALAADRSVRRFSSTDDLSLVATIETAIRMDLGVSDGTLSADMNNNRARLTPDTFERLHNALASKETSISENLNRDFQEVLRIASTSLNFYQQERSTGIVGPDAAANKAAFNSVENTLRREMFEGDLTTRSDMMKRMDELVEERKSTLITDLQSDMVDSLKQYNNGGFASSFNLGMFNTVEVNEALDTLTNALSGQNASQSQMRSMKLIVKTFMRRMPK